QLSVDHLQRGYLDLPDRERRPMNHRVRYQLRQPAAEMRRLKDVLKDPAKVDPCDLIRKDRHRPVPEIQWPDVIQPKNMIDVTVRDQHCIQPANIRAQGLLPKI